MVTDGYTWLSMVICGYRWLYMVIDGYSYRPSTSVSSGAHMASCCIRQQKARGVETAGVI